MRKLIILLLSFLYFVALIKFSSIWLADVYYKKAEKLSQSLNFGAALDYSQKSLEKNPLEPRYYYGRAKALLASSVNLNEGKQAEVKKEALENLRLAENLNPKNLVTLKNMIPIYYYLGINLNSPAASPKLDTQFAPETQSYYRRIKHYSPNDVSIYTLVARYENLMGFKEDLNVSKKAIEKLRPDLLQWYLTTPQQ